MAGEQKRRRRAMWITKAMLLGYTIEKCTMLTGLGRVTRSKYRLVSPNGLMVTYPHARTIIHFAAPWSAAKYALDLSGVDPNEENT